MKLRAFQKWPQNSASFCIVGYRALFRFPKFPSFAILEAAKKETLFSKESRDCLHWEKGGPWPRFEYLMKRVCFFLFFLEIK